MDWHVVGVESSRPKCIHTQTESCRVHSYLANYASFAKKPQTDIRFCRLDVKEHHAFLQLWNHVPILSQKDLPLVCFLADRGTTICVVGECDLSPYIES